jgi:probable HAF family extracellular repeat protein
MKKWSLLATIILVAGLTLGGCGSGGGDSDSPGTTPPITTPPVTPPPGTPPPVTTTGGSLGPLRDLGDYLNSTGEEWFFATTKDINSAGLIIGQSPKNNLILWTPNTAPLAPAILTEIPSPATGMLNGFGLYYDDFYNQKANPSDNKFVSFEVLQINDAGLVIGNAYAGAGESRGFVWNSKTDTFIDLTPPNFLDGAGKRVVGSYSKAIKINVNGELLVAADDSEGDRRAYFWNGETFDTVSDLLADDGTTISSFAVPRLIEVPGILSSPSEEPVALNDNWQVVISSTATEGGSQGVYFDFNIFGWAALGRFPDGSSSIPVDINNNKHIVGTSGTEGFFWDGGVMYPISNPSGAPVEIVGINNNDIVVGNSDNQAFVWTINATTREGVFTPIGTLGGASSTAVAINDLNEVIGYSTTGNNYSEGNVTAAVTHGFLWKNNLMYDLGAHSPPNYAYSFNPDFYFSKATAISETGIVTGISYSINGHARGFTLTPLFP